MFYVIIFLYLSSRKIIQFHPSGVYFNISTAGGKGPSDYLTSATKIFLKELVTSECSGNCSIRSQGEVNVKLKTDSSDLSLNWNTEEGYSLELSGGGNNTYSICIDILFKVNRLIQQFIVPMVVEVFFNLTLIKLVM